MADEKSNYDAFLRQVRDLDIKLSQSSDGVFTACTYSEPLFCFDADTREDLAERVRRTFVSYASHFYGIKDLDVALEDVPLAGAALPVEVSTPLATIKPVFAEAA